MCIEVWGGQALCGKVWIQGSKNAALPMIAGALLHDGITVIHNCPKILDVVYMVQILREMGCQAEFEGHTLWIDAKNLDTCRVYPEYACRMRSSIVLMGSLLGRRKEAVLPYPGGCTIGERPIDLHLDALTRMGADIEENGGVLEARSNRLQGIEISLKFPSVGATENLILAAVLAEGETVIQNAAREPEIRQLCDFLEGKGARISGGGSSSIRIRGVSALHDSEYELKPDRIVTGTYLLAAAATRGRISIPRAPAEQMESFLEVLGEIGGRFWMEPQDPAHKEEVFIFEGKDACLPANMVETAVYPGFPTDLQSPLMTVLAVAEGESRIRENVFENRFQPVPELVKMGAEIRTRGREAIITGVAKLEGNHVCAPDLRGGAALVIAGLCAGGRTRIENEQFIERGYEDIAEDLGSLGARIRRAD